VLVALPLGHLTDRRGTRGTMLAGAGLMLISTVLLATVGGTLPGLLAANVLLGFAQIIVMMCLQSGVALLWPPEGRNSAYGWFAFATAIGQMVGPGVLALIGGSDLTPETFPVYLVGAAAAVVMAGCAVAWALRAPPHGFAGTDQDAPLRWRAAFRVPGLASATLTSLTVLAAIDLLGVYLPALGVEYGISAGAIGLLLMVRAGASTLSRALMGMLLRAIGERALLIGSLAIACVSIALVPVPLPLPALVALMALAGIGLGYAHPLTLAWVANAAPEQVRGAAIAVRLLGNRIGQTVLPAAAGALTLSAGTGVVFWAIAATLGGVTVLSARARPGGEKK
jgi:MFS family permease